MNYSFSFFKLSLNSGRNLFKLGLWNKVEIVKFVLINSVFLVAPFWEREKIYF